MTNGNINQNTSQIAPTTLSPLPPPKPKTKHVPPQPPQRYRDPIISDSDEMSDRDSIVALSSNSSDVSTNDLSTRKPQGYPPAPPSRATDPSSDHEMDTEDTTDQHVNKRKRADTNPEDTGPPASSRPFNASLPLNHPNQLGLSTGSRDPNSATNSPTSNRNQLSQLPTGMNISTAIFHGNAISSTPRGIPPTNPRTVPSRKKKNPHPLTHKVRDADVTGFIGDNPLTGLDPTVILSWKNISGLKALAYPHDASYSEKDKGRIAEEMELAIALHLNGQRPIITVSAQNMVTKFFYFRQVSPFTLGARGHLSGGYIEDTL